MFEGPAYPYWTWGRRCSQTAAPEELIVHRTDGHPNEVAHRLAAEEIERFLRAQELRPSMSELEDSTAGGEETAASTESRRDRGCGGRLEIEPNETLQRLRGGVDTGDRAGRCNRGAAGNLHRGFV